MSYVLVVWECHTDACVKSCARYITIILRNSQVKKRMFSPLNKYYLVILKTDLTFDWNESLLMMLAVFEQVFVRFLRKKQNIWGFMDLDFAIFLDFQIFLNFF